MTTDKGDSEKHSKIAGQRYALVIDADQVQRRLLTEALSGFELDCVAFEEVDAAVKHLSCDAHAALCVIFLGAQAPWLEGLAVIKYVKQFPHTASVPQLRYVTESNTTCIYEARTLGAMGARPTCFKGIGLEEILENLRLIGKRAVSEPEQNAMSGCQDFEGQDEVHNHQEDQPVQAQTSLAKPSIESRFKDKPHESGMDEMIGPSEATVQESSIEECISSEGSTTDSTKRLINSFSYDQVVYASASNDAQSFREHSTVVTYLRSLEESHKNSIYDDIGLPSGNSGLLGVPTRTGIWASDEDDYAFETFQGSYGHTDNLITGLNESLIDRRRRADREMELGFERVQQRFEHELYQQTSTLQDTLGLMMDVQTETIDRQMTLANRANRMDRWLRIVCFSMVLMVASFWILTQSRLQQLNDEVSEGFQFSEMSWETASAINPNVLTPASAPAVATKAPNLKQGALSLLDKKEQARLVDHFQFLLNQQKPISFGEVALDDEQASRLRNALESLSLLGFKGVVEVTSHVSPYCVDYNNLGTPRILNSSESLNCQLWPADALQAERIALQQSLEFASLMDRFGASNQTIQVKLSAAIEGVDYAVLNQQFNPSQSGQVKSAAGWNQRAGPMNRVSYRIITPEAQL